jgi:hypothetical protein
VYSESTRFRVVVVHVEGVHSRPFWRARSLSKVVSRSDEYEPFRGLGSAMERRAMIQPSWAVLETVEWLNGRRDRS